MAALMTKPPVAKKKPGKKNPGKGVEKYTGLNKSQNKLVNQQMQRDQRFGDQADGMMGAIEQSYAQPFDWEQLPAAPVQGDYQGWIDSQMKGYNEAFDQRMNPQFQQQLGDFEQQMANRGIPMGSELYNREKSRIEQSQNDARTQAYAAGQGQAISGASQLFNIGTSARGNALQEGLQERNMPLNEYNNLIAAQSPMGTSSLAFSQQKELQAQAEKNQRWLSQNQHTGGGGGGGGSGLGGYQGTGMSFQDYLNAQNQSKLALQQGMNALTPQQQVPSYGGQIAGGLLGVGAGILGNYLGGGGWWS